MSTPTDLTPIPVRADHQTRRAPSLSRRAVLGGGLGLLLTSGGTAGWAYDRFVREKVEVADVAAAEAQAVPGAASTSGTWSGSGYASSTTTITITRHTEGAGSSALAWFAADITLTEATLVRTGLAQNKFGQNITAMPSQMAVEQDAVLAINGDYYGFRSNGIIVRDGVAYRDEPAREGLVLYRDGRVEVYDETATSADALIADGAWNTLSFGPAVLRGGRVPAGIEDVEVDTNPGNHSIQGEQPRTAIGVVGANHLVFLVVDGRSEGYSRGVGLPELGQILADLGCVDGYNLDGGGSSVMIAAGQMVNDPLGRGQERATSDILYVAG